MNEFIATFRRSDDYQRLCATWVGKVLEDPAWKFAPGVASETTLQQLFGQKR